MKIKQDFLLTNCISSLWQGWREKYNWCENRHLPSSLSWRILILCVICFLVLAQPLLTVGMFYEHIDRTYVILTRVSFNTCLNIYRTWNKTTLWIPYLTLRKNRQNNGTVFEKKESYTISSWSKVVRKLSAKKFKDVICGQTSQIICTVICSI